jgi:cell division protein FtsL
MQALAGTSLFIAIVAAFALFLLPFAVIMISSRTYKIMQSVRRMESSLALLDGQSAKLSQAVVEIKKTNALLSKALKTSENESAG